jgi:hypothetical protein
VYTIGRGDSNARGRAMKNKYVVAIFLLAMGLGIGFVVTAATIAANAAN